MAGYNRITLVGNLVRDPEVMTWNDQPNTNFTLAVERYMGKDNKPVTDFFNVVSWGKLAEVCGSDLSKGKKVLVDGHIQIRSYMKNEKRQWIVEVVAENLKFIEELKEGNNDE